MGEASTRATLRREAKRLVKESSEGNTEDTKMSKSKETVSTKQERIARNAKKLPEVSFTSVAYHIDMEWMDEAYRSVRKDGATGIDGETGKEYGKDLAEKLSRLRNRIKSGRYKAPPVKRAYIPKNKTEKRPIGVPTFEDKVAQKAIQMVLEPLYEQDFYDFSYGFRPGKSQHMALNRMWNEIMNMKGAYIIDLDISKYFDTIDHTLLRETLQKRVKDGIVIRMIGKWLNAGVMEQGKLSRPGKGSPQGGVISPMPSNIYLHEVLDGWFVNVVRPRMAGKASMLRYADDALLMFEREDDLNRVTKVLPKRFAKYGLKMNESKTQVGYAFCGLTYAVSSYRLLQKRRRRPGNA
jgi:RNA-directed DNA polymerase